MLGLPFSTLSAAVLNKSRNSRCNLLSVCLVHSWKRPLISSCTDLSYQREKNCRLLDRETGELHGGWKDLVWHWYILDLTKSRRKEEYSSLYSERWLLQQWLQTRGLNFQLEDGVTEEPFLRLLIAQAYTAWGHDYQVKGHFMKPCFEVKGVVSYTPHKWSPITSFFVALKHFLSWIDQTDNVPIMSFIRWGRTDPTLIQSSLKSVNGIEVQISHPGEVIMAVPKLYLINYSTLEGPM